MSGSVPALHPAGMFLLIAFLAASWIFRKSFCGWLCPVGTVSEYLWRVGRSILGAISAYRAPRTSPPQSEIHPVGAVSLCSRLDAGPRDSRLSRRPYGVVDDVKMLNFFRFLG